MNSLWNFTSGISVSAVPGNSTDPNVYAYLAMNEASGNLTVPAGGTAAGSTLTKNGTPTYSVTSGVPKGLGSAITFANATSDAFTCGTTLFGHVIGTQDFVVELWLKLSAPGTEIVFSQGGYNTGGGTGFRLGVGDLEGNGRTAGTPFVQVSSTLGIIAAPTTAVIDTAWHKWRMVWKNSTGTLSLFIDGVLAGTSTNAAMIGSNIVSVRNFWIGWASDYGIGFNGSIADLRFTFGNSTNNTGFNAGWRPQP